MFKDVLVRSCRKYIKTNPGDTPSRCKCVPQKHSRKHSATDGTTMDLNIGDSPGFAGQIFNPAWRESLQDGRKCLMSPWLISPLTWGYASYIYIYSLGNPSQTFRSPRKCRNSPLFMWVALWVPPQSGWTKRKKVDAQKIAGFHIPK